MWIGSRMPAMVFDVLSAVSLLVVFLMNWFSHTITLAFGICKGKNQEIGANGFNRRLNFNEINRKPQKQHMTQHLPHNNS